MSRDAGKFIVCVVFAIGVVEAGRVAGWNDETKNGIALLVVGGLVMSFMLYDALRPSQRRR